MHLRFITSPQRHLETRQVCSRNRLQPVPATACRRLAGRRKSVNDLCARRQQAPAQLNEPLENPTELLFIVQDFLWWVDQQGPQSSPTSVGSSQVFVGCQGRDPSSGSPSRQKIVAYQHQLLHRPFSGSMAIGCWRRGYVTNGPGVLRGDWPRSQVVTLHGVGNVLWMCMLSLLFCLCFYVRPIPRLSIHSAPEYRDYYL